MTGFSVNPNPTQYGEISSDFWPIINIDDFVAKQRVGGLTIPEPRLREALISAIIHVEDELTNKLAEWQVGGNSRLENVNAPQIDGKSRLVQLWQTAVYSIAAALLIETNPDISTTNDGFTQSGAITPTASELRYQAQDAIRKIKGGQSGFARLI